MSYFSLPISTQLISYNVFKIKHSEKIRALFSQLFFCENVDIDKIQDVNGVSNFYYDKELRKIVFSYDVGDYMFLVDYEAKNKKSFLNKSFFAPFLFKKGFSVFHKDVLIYENGKIYPEFEKHEINIHNHIVCLGLELKNS